LKKQGFSPQLLKSFAVGVVADENNRPFYEQSILFFGFCVLFGGVSLFF
jgi:hypothetical protein